MTRTYLLVTQRWGEDDDNVRTPDGPPVDYVASGKWPHAVLEEGAPPSAHIAQALAGRLLTVMRERGLSARRVANLVGTTHPTIGRILDGTGMTDVRSVFLLEVALQVPLWPADLYGSFHISVQTPEAPKELDGE